MLYRKTGALHTALHAQVTAHTATPHTQVMKWEEFTPAVGKVEDPCQDPCQDFFGDANIWRSPPA